MPSPLSPCSSQEIIPISPPIGSSSSSASKHRRKTRDPDSTVLPRPKSFVPKGELKESVIKHLKDQEKRIEIQGGRRKVKRGTEDVDAREPKRSKGKECANEEMEMSRTQVTNRMVRGVKLCNRGSQFTQSTDVDPWQRFQSNHQL